MKPSTVDATLRLKAIPNPMPQTVRTLREHHPALLGKLALIERGYLAVVALNALGALGVEFVPAMAQHLPHDWTLETPQVAVASLLSAAGLEFTRSRHPAGVKWIGAFLATVLAFLSGAELVRSLSHAAAGTGRLAATLLGSAQPERIAALTAAAFAVLAAVMIFSALRSAFASHAADFFVSVLCLLILLMVRNYLLEGLRSSSSAGRTSLLTLLSLALLAFVAFMHRAEVGVFSTLLGEGSGSRIARFAAPVVLLVPFLPQTALAQAVKSGLLSSEYLSAFIAFLAAGVTLTLILYMAWKINQLEEKIRELSLRDEDTGLLNRRGFHLVAWQVLRHARRDSLAFSVMLVELTNLDEICKSFGPAAGAEMLGEMGQVLQGAFRATDVLGRIDPTQFAVAGHFDEKASGIMRLRLQETVNYRNSHPGRTFSLKISSGCVHAKDPKSESLEDLLARANDAGEPEYQGAAPTANAGPKDAR